MFKWKVKFCKYGRAWYSPFLMIDHAEGSVGIALVAFRWQVSVSRVHTKAYWEAAFSQDRQTHYNEVVNAEPPVTGEGSKSDE